MLTAVSYETYVIFARRYGIRLTTQVNGKRKKKSMKVLKKQIWRYENKYNVKGGLY
jgi:hypothetical protein